MTKQALVRPSLVLLPTNVQEQQNQALQPPPLLSAMSTHRQQRATDTALVKSQPQAKEKPTPVHARTQQLAQVSPPQLNELNLAGIGEQKSAAENSVPKRARTSKSPQLKLTTNRPFVRRTHDVVQPRKSQVSKICYNATVSSDSQSEKNCLYRLYSFKEFVFGAGHVVFFEFNL